VAEMITAEENDGIRRIVYRFIEESEFQEPWTIIRASSVCPRISCPRILERGQRISYEAFNGSGKSSIRGDLDSRDRLWPVGQNCIVI